MFQSDSVRGHALRIGRYLILFGEATDRVDLGNASNVSQLRLDDPVLDFTQVGRRVGLTIRTARLGLGLDRPEEDFPQAGGDGTESDLHALRKLVARGLQPFTHQLPGEIEIGAIIKDYGDLSEPGAR